MSNYGKFVENEEDIVSMVNVKYFRFFLFFYYIQRMNKDLFFLGIQGCGKGTQGKLLFKALPGQYDYLEMGQLFRGIMSNDNIIGNYCKNIVNSGGLVPHFVSHGRYDIALQIVTEKKV